MNIFNCNKKIVFVGYLLWVVAANSIAADIDRVSELEQEIKQIKDRLNNLEKIVVGKKSDKKPIVASDSWKYLSNWRALKNGMAYEDVKSLLGEPSKIDGGSVAYWIYPNKGRVIFVRDKIQSWEEPDDLIK
jgi:hypothetical protein